MRVDQRILTRVIYYSTHAVRRTREGKMNLQPHAPYHSRRTHSFPSSSPVKVGCVHDGPPSMPSFDHIFCNIWLVSLVALLLPFTIETVHSPNSALAWGTSGKVWQNVGTTSFLSCLFNHPAFLPSIDRINDPLCFHLILNSFPLNSSTGRGQYPQRTICGYMWHYILATVMRLCQPFGLTHARSPVPLTVFVLCSRRGRENMPKIKEMILKWTQDSL